MLNIVFETTPDFLSCNLQANSDLAREIRDTWDHLLYSLFNPNPDMSAFYEAWGAEYYGTEGILHISSSMGIVIQRLWGRQIGRSHAYSAPSRRITWNFMHQHTLVHSAADIALRLLGCR
jgi:hypothetical protein